MSTIELAESVLQNFMGVETFLNSYQGLDRIARGLKRRILALKTNFTLEVGCLLSRNNNGKGIFSQVASESDGVIKSIRNDHLFEDDIKFKLGHYYGPLQGYMNGAEQALEDIIGILEELARDNSGEDGAPETLGPVVAKFGIISILGLCLWHLVAIFLASGYPEVPIKTEIESEKPVSVNLKLRGSPREPELEELLVELKENVDFVSKLRQLTYDPTRPGSRPFKTSSIPSPPASEPLNNSEKSKSKQKRVILNTLYNVLSEDLVCRCHFVHLCLCSVPAAHSNHVSSSRKPMDPGLICSFFITLDLKNSMDTYAGEDPLYLTASRRGFGNTSVMPPTPRLTPSPTGYSTSCSKIITSPPGFRHHLVHSAPPPLEFLLESTKPPSCSPKTYTPSNPPTLQPILTLREILVSHFEGKSKIELEDRFFLAAKLGQWVLQHHDTPWLRDLDANEIRFFTRCESDSKYGNWTPYISTSFKELSYGYGQPNKEFYALGLVLLELGLEKPLVYVRGGGKDEARILRVGTRDLSKTLGRTYKSVVEKLLEKGKSGDSIDEKLISELENDMKFIKAKALDFLPE
ncbi:hypothetical protein L873DRAFT_1838521 [Choiromyces venosus 120613-1]|uniref:DUF7580 domain-containing protein n=1 Tax=Choiromyces venosus 120613-1 TaxID=1336337 RepID=A0A3N4J1N8_9PEZI|nr:hypothetical protein L873DRAFT_1838521 [Choiromyces venosus 120613-1]